jgi:vancomycin resistance protein VanW
MIASSGEAIVQLPPALCPRAPRLSERLPFLYGAAVYALRLKRRLRWATSPHQWAAARKDAELPIRVYTHKSLLLRTLGETEMWLQHNKVHNLRIATPRLHGLLLRPGEVFSFCRLVGRATARKGYKVGMLLDNGEAKPGIGGGICQLANLLHWMVLHTPLTVIERSEHSFDPFPDHARVLPWGVGCAIYYNYVDLQFRNDTESTFQLLVNVGEKYLEGEIRADRELPHSYKVFARKEEFLKQEDRWFRRNEIWRSVINRQTGVHLYDELVKKNFALVKYVPQQVQEGRGI